ncbi:MAG: shikimate dehydrogenase, partial [Oscillospiraceae bacterium]|nr:shikimate dehydrogenase [Oscillospiraceae bacterium]
MAEKIKLAVIGSPVGHSLSPFIHRRFAETLGLDIEYEKREVTSETLEAFIAEARRGGLRGFNVTMPLKKAVLPYLAERDDISLECGAVNTVVSRDGGLSGHNTDGLGIVRSLKSRIPELRGKKALILGGGGLAHIASSALRREGASASPVVREN